jgi:hypothetical protein
VTRANRPAVIGGPGRIRRRPFAPGMTALALVASSTAGAADAVSLGDAVSQARLILDARLRYENVDQAGIASEANATTLRARLGFETGPAWKTTLLLEGEAVAAFDDRYRPDPLDPAMAAYPVVADPESSEINRIQLQNTSIPDTTLTIGRQRIQLDDQRFVGNVGWRQNEQTFDAVRVSNASLENLVMDVTYLNRVNRVFGEDSPQGTYRGDGVLLNVSYQLKIGKITGFGYLLEFDPVAGVPAAAGDSTSTRGVRFEGRAPLGKVDIGYRASWATQSDAGANPFTLDLDYAAAEITAGYRQFQLGAGIEVLDGDGTKGFATPLATLHKFQGWADKFLTTPADGIEDTYLNALANLESVGFLDTVSIVLAYHDYEGEHVDADFGSEWNVSVAAGVPKFNFMLKYADYREGTLASARNTTKIWIQVEYAW